MAIIQISKIQVRRGLQENLPQLAGGELGWSIDERKLFIGNGTIAEGAPELGNTELLTEFSDIFSLSEVYTYSGIEAGGYVVQTGPSLIAPSSRSLQDKLDDIVNLRDFGGVGDGANDEVDAFNRAITQLYASSLQDVDYKNGRTSIRRTLHIPAGTYILDGTHLTDLSANSIKMLPYVKLRGDGKNSTIIIQRNANAPCVLMSADSRGQIGVNIGNNAIFPQHIEIEGLTLINETQNDVVQFDSLKDAMLNSVRIQGSQMVTNPADALASCVNFLSSTSTSTTNITFNRCEFLGASNGMLAVNRINNVRVVDSKYEFLHRGINLGTFDSPTPYAFKISHSLFDTIVKEGILTSQYGSSPVAPIGVSDGTINIVSAFNTYRNVGNVGTTPTFNVINFGGANSYSIGDTFDRAYTETVPAVNLNGKTSFATLPNGRLQLGKQVTAGGISVELDLSDTAVKLAGIVGVGDHSTTVDYKIVRPTDTRLGTIKISPLGATLTFDESFVENGTTSVDLIPTMAGGLIELHYAATILGANATLTTTSVTLI